MTGTLDWMSKTNICDGSLTEAQCGCNGYWELLQQRAIIKLSNLKDQTTGLYHLEPGYEARAKRIAAAYANLYLEQDRENGSQSKYRGRYYWMGLGAFASKTVAVIFNHWGSQLGHDVGIRDALNQFAKGNLWLFMDIFVWHAGWGVDQQSFQDCFKLRDASQYQKIQNSMNNLPWSSCLTVIEQLRWTENIENGFNYVSKIEEVFDRAGTNRRNQFNNAKNILLDHLLEIAQQEQKNILQKIVWENGSVKVGAWIQRWFGWTSIPPDATLVLSSDYDVDQVQQGLFGYQGRNKQKLEQLPEEPYSSPLKGTIAEDYDSRMNWINSAAEKYHRLMLDDHGRSFLESELNIIAGWGNSRANFRVSSSSNEGKT